MSFEIGIPNVTFKMRVEIDEAPGFEWKEVPSMELFANKRVALFGLPGAFTPTCSSQQLPEYEDKYEQILSNGIDEVYCLSVNDAFVMNAWFRDENIKNVKSLADGEGAFTQEKLFIANLVM